MNNKKIAFITCVNDDILYDECLRYIGDLEIPEGYEIDVISVREAKSITSAYNNAMNSTDAKYKVYLHQDTLIINKYFIKNILEIFNSDKNIGMIGMVGCENIPINAVWWEANKKYGKVYESHTGNMQLLAFDEIVGAHEEVKAIDGFIMITQHDIEWREDLFDGWHFYDISQSVEFIKNGYKVVIPKQQNVWCIHECGIVNVENNYEEYRKIFLDEYSKKIFPLVSILIPTYNRPEYFELALQSAINQTYPNIEIIIGDDSTNSDTEEIINNKYINKVDNIKYYHNSKNIGQFDNYLKLMELANGEYINFLMDDDLFEPTKIEKMIKYFINDIDEKISLVTSNRNIIDDNGKINGSFILDKIFDGKDVLNVNGGELVKFLLIYNYNIIGEPTTVLFRKDKLKDKFGCYKGRRYICNVDQATWFNLLENGNAIIIKECLSSFRRHVNQQLKHEKMLVGGAEDYVFSIIEMIEKKMFHEYDEYESCIDNCLKYLEYIKYKVNDRKRINNLYNTLIKHKKLLSEHFLDKELTKTNMLNNTRLNNERDLFVYDREAAREVIQENKKVVDLYLSLMRESIRNEKYEEVAFYAFKYGSYACEKHPGEYCNKELENLLIKCAEKIKPIKLQTDLIKLNIKDSKRKVLHVISEAYDVGGHTRQLWNWIRSDNESISSVVATWQLETAPSWLKAEIEKRTGFILSLNNYESSFLKKAALLRAIANEWADIIVLHTHMQDPIPLLAFGVDGEKPVVYMNHADHRFWIGASISDVVVDGREWGKYISLNKRGITKSQAVHLPLEVKEKYCKSELRKKYNINEDTKVMLTIASEDKFISLNSNHYIKIIKEIVDKIDNIVIFIIGPKSKGVWRMLENYAEGKVKVLGIQNEVEDYYKISDFYMDSFMIGGPTAILNAALYGLKVIRFNNRYNPIFSDYGIELEDCIFNSVNEIIKFINETNMECDKNITESILEKHNSNTNKEINLLYNSLNKHKVNKELEILKECDEIDEFWALLKK
ncbi:glycosyltransferase [Clostridium sp. SM-530-WT-3G]|uniref:glycosyltransferase n=1 Tax=Clostridium sp. SM-530-WT-3G TaxID=2725303 RepID=UPI00145C5A69|nr:glycosyltransferase [Clostridium sp. SM-530-WT-3G]NME82787.1 glycosyltransferase [Clostridium sp. SM-530-WT-3G]